MSWISQPVLGHRLKTVGAQGLQVIYFVWMMRILSSVVMLDKARDQSGQAVAENKVAPRYRFAAA